jgi:hypothetical protein
MEAWKSEGVKKSVEMFRAAPVVVGFVLEAWNDAYTPFRPSRASCSNRSSTVSPAHISGTTSTTRL